MHANMLNTIMSYVQMQVNSAQQHLAAREQELRDRAADIAALRARIASERENLEESDARALTMAAALERMKGGDIPLQARQAQEEVAKLQRALRAETRVKIDLTIEIEKLRMAIEGSCKEA